MVGTKLITLDYGWGDVETPDDIYFKIIKDGSEFELYSSLKQLAILYGCIVNECNCEFYLGTGSPAVTIPSEESMILQVETIRIKSKKEDSRENIEQLLKGIFEEKDQIGQMERRENKLRLLDDFTEKYYCCSDLLELYNRLMMGVDK